MSPSRRKQPRPRLIDDGALAISRDRSRRADKRESAWHRSQKHRSWVAGFACIGRATLHDGKIEAAHVRIGADGCGEEKPSDYYVIPLCQRCHKLQHTIGERSFHRMFGFGDYPARVAVERFGLRSPCIKTKIAAQEEWDRRYGDRP